MINFNEPVYLEKSMEYVKKAILINKRLNGDGEFTAKCREWMEQRFGAQRYCSRPPARTDWKWRHCCAA